MTETEGNLIIPKHLGFILDGNRRWAKKRGLPTLEGHRLGMKRVEELIENCIERGIKHVTVFAFSTENWQRPQEEVDYLMDLFRIMFQKTTKKLQKQGVRFVVAGRVEDFAPDLQESMKRVMEETKDNDVLTFNMAASYGGRAEILDVTRRIVADGLKPAEITEDKFVQYLYEAGQPDLDMIVRTSGEQRISGFMLWQAAYSEFYFPEIAWPDFDAKELDKVIEEYNKRERRFGK